MSLRVLLLAATIGLLSFTTFAGVKEDISQRTSPIGGVCMAGDPCAAAVVEAVAGPRSGDEIYNAKCVACHNTGAAGAPKIADVAAWAPRIEKGVETLYTNAINGINGMPPKGLCGDCSDDDIKATVDYILSQSQ